MTTFDFTWEDLQANRSGVLSERQRRFETRQVRFFDRLVAGLLLVYFAAAALTGSNDLRSWGSLAIVGLILLGVGAWLRRVVRNASPSIGSTVVDSVVGPAAVAETHETWSVVVGGRVLYGPTSGHDPFASDRAYIGYFSTGNQRLRSIEPARKQRGEDEP